VTPPTSLIITLAWPLYTHIFWQETIEDLFVITFNRRPSPRIHGVYTLQLIFLYGLFNFTGRLCCLRLTFLGDYLGVLSLPPCIFCWAGSIVYYSLHLVGGPSSLSPTAWLHKGANFLTCSVVE
jgi:hypothetical protein